jgi:hypothetical protein
MAWEKGRYYTRSRRVAGRVVREYVGTGPGAQLAAAQDETRRQEALANQIALQREKAEVRELEASLAALDTLCAAFVTMTLEADAYHQHDRGEWRKRRGQTQAD